MTNEERIDANDRQIEALIQLAVKHGEAIGGLATAVEAHDRQLEALIAAVSQQRVTIENMGRQWQAYINTLPRQ